MLFPGLDVLPLYQSQSATRIRTIRTSHAPTARRDSRRDMARIEPLPESGSSICPSSHPTHSKVCNEVPGSSSDRILIFLFFTQWRCVHGRITTDRRTGCLSSHLGLFRIACAPRPLLAATTSFDHGSKSPAAEKSGCYSLLVECGYRCYEYREGCNGYDTSQGCFRLRQRYPHYGPSGSDSSFAPINCKLTYTGFYDQQS